jgi:conjugal transfer/entry exclusion protein
MADDGDENFESSKIEFSQKTVHLEIEEMENERQDFHQLQQLFQSRNNILKKVQKVELALKSYYRDEIDIFTVKAKCSMLDRFKGQFNDIQSKIYANLLCIED